MTDFKLLNKMNSLIIININYFLKWNSLKINLRNIKRSKVGQNGKMTREECRPIITFAIATGFCCN